MHTQGAPVSPTSVPQEHHPRAVAPPGDCPRPTALATSLRAIRRAWPNQRTAPVRWQRSEARSGSHSPAATSTAGTACRARAGKGSASRSIKRRQGRVRRVPAHVFRAKVLDVRSLKHKSCECEQTPAALNAPSAQVPRGQKSWASHVIATLSVIDLRPACEGTHSPSV